MIKSPHILWIDDEVNHLKPHIVFLEQRNYAVTKCMSGLEAIELLASKTYDIVFLDQNMPGLSGIDTLLRIKADYPNLPVIMITKSEEEILMDNAIGHKVQDFLLKPINPSQILAALKKNLDNSKLVSQQTTVSYRQEFLKLGEELHHLETPAAWSDFYKRLVYWDIELSETQDTAMLEVLSIQKQDANRQFAKYVAANYQSWFSNRATTLSHTVFKDCVLKELSRDKPTLLVVVDNMRLDHWKAIEKIINASYTTAKEQLYFSILPTTTQYARNALFSGMLPLDIKRNLPQYWVDDVEQKGKNLYEDELLSHQIQVLDSSIKFEYVKVASAKSLDALDFAGSTSNNKLYVVVYNFLDVISHSKTEINLIKELASTDKQYRALVKNWFDDSMLLKIIQKAAANGIKMILTTDHGAINVKQARKTVSTKDTTPNLRYKSGVNLTFDDKVAVPFYKPESIGLPASGVADKFIFAKGEDYFVYAQNYNSYANYYKNTYQHGGISMEEMIVPLAVLTPK